MAIRSIRLSRRRAPLRHVVLLVDTSRAYGRGLVHGVASYNRKHGRWRITFNPHGLQDPPPPWIYEARPDGILARIGNAQVARALVKIGVPTVDLRGVIAGTGFPSVGVDNREVARIAVEHFLERGFKQFAFCGLPQGVHPHMDDLSHQFVLRLAEAGYACDVFHGRQGPLPGEAWEIQQNRLGQWRDQQERLVRWVRQLPKPVAIMACHDDRALQVLDACRRARVLVPEEAAVLSTDNDEHLCELAVPPLSSIDENPVRIGYEAAALLDRMMNGEPVPAQRFVFPPLGVATRASTDLLAVNDPHVARALCLIREHAAEGIRPTHVLSQLPVSRATLAGRFKSIVGRTLGEEICRVRVRLAQELLSRTDLPIKQIAARAGFRSVEYFTRQFRRLTGLPPATYRRRFTV
ncbi:MAG: DNA-binding transcriptional regulator [Verrucomicrobiae bacterium]|nr:DNA-binding transcriptional regulator [Verrucomicrobiae bacterium]